MNVTQAIRSGIRRVTNNQPFLLIGGAGVGKTSIGHEIARQTDHDLLISYPALSDPTSANGIPYPSKDGKTASFLAYGVLAEALRAKRPTLWMMDDFGHASPEVQKAYMHLFLARRIDGHVIPDCVKILATTNRKGEKSGANGMLEPVKSRFVTMIDVVPTLECWKPWAYNNAISPLILAYLQMNPGNFYLPAPTLDLVNSPSPRTWHNASDILAAGLDEDAEVVLEEFTGALGSSTAGDLVRFFKVADEMPNLDNLLMFPEKADLPTDLSVKWLTTLALARMAKPANIKSIGAIAVRLAERGDGELATVLVRHSAESNPALLKAAGYTRLLTTPQLSELLK